MGCFSYLCDGCQGEKCNQNGGQNGGCKSIIEVPLSDGRTVYLKGRYEEYGSVNIEFQGETYEFYPIQFKEYFRAWVERESEKYRKFKFLGGKVYTYSYKDYVEYYSDNEYYQEKKVTRHSRCQPDDIQITKLTKEILAKCIRIML